MPTWNLDHSPRAKEILKSKLKLRLNISGRQKMEIYLWLSLISIKRCHIHSATLGAHLDLNLRTIHRLS